MSTSSLCFLLALQSLYSVIAGLFKPWILVLDKEDARYTLHFKMFFFFLKERTLVLWDVSYVISFLTHNCIMTFHLNSCYVCVILLTIMQLIHQFHRYILQDLGWITVLGTKLMRHTCQEAVMRKIRIAVSSEDTLKIECIFFT